MHLHVKKKIVSIKEEKEFINEINVPGNYFVIFSEANKSKVLFVNAGRKGKDGFSLGFGSGLYSEYEINVDDKLECQLIIGAEEDPITRLIIDNNFFDPIDC